MAKPIESAESQPVPFSWLPSSLILYPGTGEDGIFMQPNTGIRDIQENKERRIRDYCKKRGNLLCNWAGYYKNSKGNSGR